MRILFLTRHFGCLRNFERPIFALAAAGHHLHLVAHQDDVLGGGKMVARWAAAEARITFERLPDREITPHEDLETRIRLLVDYARYLEPAYQHASGLVKRAVERTPRIGLRVAESRLWRSRPGRAVARTALRMIERSLPRAEYIDRYIRDQRPDVVLFTPLLALGSAEMAYLDATCAAAIPSVFCVWSWDNLSSKALIRTVPDAILVWNETQKREAMTLHRVPGRRVIVTGAQSFDQWFEWRSTRTHAEFCRHVGLPDDRPYLLWVCSALLRGSPPETLFARHWLEQLRQSTDTRLREAAVIIRPHPSRLHEWDQVPLDNLGPVTVWGENPVDAEARADYFDSLSHAAGVVGLNTSAFLEAAIIGRPVYTILLPENYENQEGMLHFAYLTEDPARPERAAASRTGGGLLHTSRHWAEHHAQLIDALIDPESAAHRSRRFVEAFIRPHGLDVTGTERFVAAINAVVARGARRRRPPFWAPLGRAIADRLLARMSDTSYRDWWLAPREHAKLEALRRRRAAKDRAREMERAMQRAGIPEDGAL